MKQKQLYAHRCGIQRIGITVHWHRSKKKNIIRILLSLTKLVFVQTVRNGNSGIRAACDNQIFRVNFSKQLCWIFDSNENDIYCLVMQTLIVGFEVCAHVCVCVCAWHYSKRKMAQQSLDLLFYSAQQFYLVESTMNLWLSCIFIVLVAFPLDTSYNSIDLDTEFFFPNINKKSVCKLS